MLSCKTIHEIEYVYRDSIRTEYKLDSIYFYERDSIYLDRSSDTIYKEVWKWRYKDKIKEIHDTTTVNNEVYIDKVIEKKFVPKWVWYIVGISGMIILGFIAYIVIRLYRKFHI